MGRRRFRNQKPGPNPLLSPPFSRHVSRRVSFSRLRLIQQFCNRWLIRGEMSVEVGIYARRYTHIPLPQFLGNKRIVKPEELQEKRGRLERR